MLASRRTAPGALPELLSAQQRGRQVVLLMKEGGIYIKHPHGSHRPVETDDPGLFVLAAASALVVYLAAPTLYTNLLLLHPTAQSAIRPRLRWHW